MTRPKVLVTTLLGDEGPHFELLRNAGFDVEVVNRQLARWKAEGLVESGRRWVVVRNPRGLALSVSILVRGDGFALPGVDGGAGSIVGSTP